MKNSKFKIHNSKYKIQNLNFKIQNTKSKIQNSKLRIQSSKFKIQYSKFKVQNIQNSKFIPQQPLGLGFQSLYPGLCSLRGPILAECTEVV